MPEQQGPPQAARTSFPGRKLFDIRQKVCAAGRSQIEGFRRALAQVGQEKPGKRSAAIRGSYEGMIRQLEDEVREYDELKAGELKPPPP